MKKVIGALSSTVVTILGITGYFLSNIILKAKKTPFSEGIACEYNLKTITREEYNGLKREKFSMKTKKGTCLRGEWLFTTKRQEGEKPKIIVICHGFEWNRAGCYKYALLFLERGFDVLLYDHAHCGESDGRYTTMGYRESADLTEVLDVVEKRYGRNVTIATMGESMGAAIVLLHMCKDNRPAFVIADCPYADLKEQVSHVLKDGVHLSDWLVRFLVSLSSLFTKVRAGFFVGEVSPVKAIEKAGGVPDIPLLLIHGLEDAFIPCEASRKIKKVKKGYVRLYLFKDAKHAQSIRTDKETYQRMVDTFLREIK